MATAAVAVFDLHQSIGGARHLESGRPWPTETRSIRWPTASRNAPEPDLLGTSEIVIPAVRDLGAVPKIDVISLVVRAPKVQERDYSATTGVGMPGILHALGCPLGDRRVGRGEGGIVGVDPELHLLNPQGMLPPVPVPTERAPIRGEAYAGEGHRHTQPNHTLVVEVGHAILGARFDNRWILKRRMVFPQLVECGLRHGNVMLPDSGREGNQLARLADVAL